MWLKKNKWKLILPVLIIAVLAAAFWYGGDGPGLKGLAAEPDGSLPYAAGSPGIAESDEPEKNSGTATAAPELSVAPDEAEEEPEPSEGVSVESGTADREYSEQQCMDIDPDTGTDDYLTSPVAEGNPVPVEPQDAELTDAALSCTLSVHCDTILDNLDWLSPEKLELVPADGVIYAAVTVTFYEGESVFNVLQREMKKAGVHMEFKNTPVYNSAYIQGIGNLYEFDCGEQSGWMYRVNGWVPNYGCSRYQLKDGDIIEWLYTCDLGADVGGQAVTGGRLQISEDEAGQ